jgi:hypothetical protein
MTDFLINKSDIDKIKDMANKKLRGLSLPMNISNKIVQNEDLVTIAMLESILMYLNREKKLTNVIKIDYTDIIPQYEPDFEDTE